MLKQARKHTMNAILRKLLVACVLVGLFSFNSNIVSAQISSTKTPERKATISVAYTTYEWWLLSWQNSQRICTIYVEREGWPKTEEVRFYCGDNITRDWLATEPCDFSDDITSTEHCPGLYLHFISATPGEREIEVELLPPTVLIDIADCDPQYPENRCDTLPRLHLIAQEPLPNEQIISIQGTIGSEHFSCMGDDCTVPLPSTGINGVEFSFWADSSYGDSTETYTGKIRVVPWGDFVAPNTETEDDPYWYVDVLSTQYLRGSESTCSHIWSAFPPVGGPPQWLSSPDHPDALFSDQPYYFLAGSLIRQGLVDASDCPGGGLQPSGVANQCGVETARPEVNEWQNQFNSEIVRIAKDTGVPAQLMKNVFSRESQFWPGYAATYKEGGLGHLSDLGADTVLLWNPSFFTEFCPLILDTTICQRGFGNLDIGHQEMLRGALVQNVSAACPECPLGIDLRQANFSISIFARSLLANCEQVSRILYNTTRRTAGEVASYEDLWRFTLVNYNAGPGCLVDAIEQTHALQLPMTWESISQHLEPGVCQMSIKYVEDIAFMPGVVPVASTPTVTPTPITPVQPTPLPPQEEEASQQPTPTPEDHGYPPPAPTDAGPYP